MTSRQIVYKLQFNLKSRFFSTSVVLYTSVCLSFWTFVPELSSQCCWNKMSWWNWNRDTRPLVEERHDRRTDEWRGVILFLSQSENAPLLVNTPLPPIHYVSWFILRGEHSPPGDTEPWQLGSEQRARCLFSLLPDVWQVDVGLGSATTETPLLFLMVTSPYCPATSVEANVSHAFAHHDVTHLPGAARWCGSLAWRSAMM